MRPRLITLALITAAFLTGAVVMYRLIMLDGIVACRSGASTLARLELLFGTGKKDGSEVTEAEWQDFLATVITPRFPDGLTVLSGYGQWHTDEGKPDRENLRVIVIWYERSKQGEEKIEAIRNAYRERFEQESVMRVDGVSCVSF
jgi:hypothetical protein